MARPRNEELFNTIKKEAYRQLMTNGYTDTTYQSIATACGVTRAAVQNYYSSKADLAFSLFGDLLAVIYDIIREKHIHEENEFDTMFCIGQSFFHYFLNDEGRTKLIYDQSVSRDLTASVLEFEYYWGIDFIKAEQTVSQQKLEDEIFFAMGGFYELLYQYIKYELDFDFVPHLGKVIIAIMRCFGYHYDEAEVFVEAHYMAREELDMMLSEIDERIEL